MVLLVQLFIDHFITLLHLREVFLLVTSQSSSAITTYRLSFEYDCAAVGESDHLWVSRWLYRP